MEAGIKETHGGDRKEEIKEEWNYWGDKERGGNEAGVKGEGNFETRTHKEAGDELKEEKGKKSKEGRNKETGDKK